MKYCKYHPTEAATWYCTHCDSRVCDTCTLESERGEDRYCCKCGATLESLGSAYTAEPFWERLSETFRYPLTVPVMTLIVVLSAISGVLFFVPIVGLWRADLGGYSYEVQLSMPGRDGRGKYVSSI